nr:MAG TPA: hypothetical protein [Bacteriophage sp.]
MRQRNCCPNNLDVISSVVSTVLPQITATRHSTLVDLSWSTRGI